MKTIIATLFILALTLTASAQQNLALDSSAVATASSIYSTNYPANGAIDGDRTGALWGSGGGWNDGTRDIWGDQLTIDWPRKPTFGKVIIYTTQNGTGISLVEPTASTMCTDYGIKDFDVEGKDASGNYQVLASIRGNDKCKIEVPLSYPFQTSSLRITVLDGRFHFSRIAEVEAYPPRF